MNAHLQTPNSELENTITDHHQQEQEPSSSSKMRYHHQNHPQHWLTSFASLLPDGSEYWSSIASLLGTLALVQTLINSIFPPYIRDFLVNLLCRLFYRTSTSSYCYFDVPDFEGMKNKFYDDVQLYLSNSHSISSATRVRITHTDDDSKLTMAPSSEEPLYDSFSGATVMWKHVVVTPENQSNNSYDSEKRCFTLHIQKKDRARIVDSYLDHIMKHAAEIRFKNMTRLLYTNYRGGQMESVTFKHPSTFDTLAMDPIKKSDIIADLRSFTEGRDFYEKTGRAWKRGYLLYGPPGTGKSSMVAAMANHLGYDIYDIELSEVRTNSTLKDLLLGTTPKSIIVIEDIDCSINLTNRSDPDKKKDVPTGPETEVTLSGLLSFTDGLWSCCGSERIFVFTTNHIENIDPALLRSGRMDMHIHMGYCGFPALKILLKNYLGVEVLESDLGDGVMKELEGVVDLAEMTPAEIGEVLIKNSRLDAKNAIWELLRVLKEKAAESQLRKKSVGVMEEKNSGGDEDSEEQYQEKRALRPK